MYPVRNVGGTSTGWRPGTTLFDRFFAARLQRLTERARVAIELWDGSPALALGEAPIGVLRIHDRRTLLGLLLAPDRQFGESYTSGRLEVAGPLAPVVEALSRLQVPEASWLDRLRAVLVSSTTPGRARHDIHQHYDLGNDFYARWLDREMVYTCAYYPTPDAPLDAAQHAKLAHVCGKLRLRRGEHVIEAGSGWGALALFMARHHGVTVRAFNLSQEQIAYARERAAREGLAGRVEFIHDDYRNISGRCDAFVSVGMLEHVGRRQFGVFAEVLRHAVRRTNGRGLLHFIGRDAPRPVNAWIRRRIFPGSYTPTLAEVTSQVLTPAGMSVLDVENLRRHYVVTLRQWRERFVADREAIAAQLGNEFTRAWELYLAGSEAAFATGWMQLFQVLFAPNGATPPYWTRG
jgi:cyclopropane-fatty-acyl-phospholipid synthase